MRLFAALTHTRTLKSCIAAQSRQSFVIEPQSFFGASPALHTTVSLPPSVCVCVCVKPV